MRNVDILLLLFFVFFISIYFHFNALILVFSLLLSAFYLLLEKRFKSIKIHPLVPICAILLLCAFFLLRADIFDSKEISLVDYPLHFSFFSSFLRSGDSIFLNSFSFGRLHLLESKYIPSYFVFVLLNLFVSKPYLVFRLLVFLIFTSVPLSMFCFLKERFNEKIAFMSAMLWILQTHDIFVYGSFYNYLSIALCFLSFFFFSKYSKSNKTSQLSFSLIFLLMSLFSYMLYLPFILIMFLTFFGFKNLKKTIIPFFLSASYLIPLSFNRFSSTSNFNYLNNANLIFYSYIFNPIVSFFNEYVFQIPIIFLFSLFSLFFPKKESKPWIGIFALFVTLIFVVYVLQMSGLPIFNTFSILKLRPFLICISTILASFAIFELEGKGEIAHYSAIFLVFLHCLSMSSYLCSGWANPNGEVFAEYHHYDFYQVHNLRLENGIFSNELNPQIIELVDWIKSNTGNSTRIFFEGSSKEKFGGYIENMLPSYTERFFASAPYPTGYSNDGFLFFENISLLNYQMVNARMEELAVREVIAWSEEYKTHFSNNPYFDLYADVGNFSVFVKHNSTMILEGATVILSSKNLVLQPTADTIYLRIPCENIRAFQNGGEIDFSCHENYLASIKPQDNSLITVKFHHLATLFLRDFMYFSLILVFILPFLTNLIKKLVVKT